MIEQTMMLACSLEMRNMNVILLVIVVFILVTTVAASSALGCYAVVVGKKASADGSVIFGHNEQNGGNRIINFRVIPRMKHKPSDVVKLLKGGTLPEVPETNSFIWSENPGLEFSDTYVNEWGVAVASDGCGTREDSYDELVARGDIVDGGIGYMLRRLIVQRAKTAREGVQIAGELLNRFGYSDSGRTLTIAGPNEAWLLSIVRGKHWVAQRVPDDEVALLPNVHIISEIDLNDSDNFMGAPDIVDYAIKRGWFDPESGKPFSFRAAYNRSTQDGWDTRQWRGQSLVTGRAHELPPAGQLPFSVKPDRKLTVKDVVNILRYHGQKGTICGPQTQEASVFQLRNWLPPEIGCIYWRTSAEPCCGVLIPWYIGITETPEVYYKPVDLAEHLTLSFHFNPPAGTFDYEPSFAWWAFKTLQDLINEDYQISESRDNPLWLSVRAVWDDFEASAFANQSAVEEEALRLFSKDKDLAKLFLTDYSKALALQAVDMTNKMVNELRTGTQAGINDSELDFEQELEKPLEKPRDFRLSQNYPNPFNLQTTITYQVAQTGPVRLSIYTLTGQFIRTLVDEDRPVGTHSVVWDGTNDAGQNVASGVYFYRMFAGSFSAMRKLLLIR